MSNVPPPPTQVLCFPRHIEAREQLHIALKANHAGQLRAVLPFGHGGLPPLGGQSCARPFLFGHAVVEVRLVPFRSRAATGADIELRQVAGDRMRSGRRSGSGNCDQRRTLGTDRDEGAAGRFVPVAGRGPVGRENRRRSLGAASRHQHRLIPAARDNALRGIAVRPHDANGRRRAGWPSRPLRPLPRRCACGRRW